MKGPLLLAAFSIVLSSTPFDRAIAQSCPDELSGCYRLSRYGPGNVYCHRYYNNSTVRYGILGIDLPGISEQQLSSAVFDAVNDWYFNTFMPFSVIYAGSDISGNNTSVQVMSTATFESKFGTDRTAATTPAYYPDGSMRSSQSFLRGANPSFAFVLDCRFTSCGLGDVDLGGALAHEIGHWWQLNDVFFPVSLTGCDSITMWFYSEGNDAFKRFIASGDRDGVDFLYDATTATILPLSIASGPDADTLHWEDPDPTQQHDFDIYASDNCWGPVAYMTTILARDPAHTQDVVHYTAHVSAPYARPYYYEIRKAGSRGKGVSVRPQGTPAFPPSAPPSVLAVVASSSGQRFVTVTWGASSGVVTAYYVYRHWLHLTSCAIGDQAPWETFGPFTTTQFVDADPAIADSLYYYARAVNTTGGSDLSNESGVWLPFLTGADGPDANVTEIRRVVPNPVAGSCEVEYSLLGAGNVELSAYDIAGRRVTAILRGPQTAGIHRTTWKPSEAAGAPGVMYLRLSVNGERKGQQRVIVLQ